MLHVHVEVVKNIKIVMEKLRCKMLRIYEEIIENINKLSEIVIEVRDSL